MTATTASPLIRAAGSVAAGVLVLAATAGCSGVPANEAAPQPSTATSATTGSATTRAQAQVSDTPMPKPRRVKTVNGKVDYRTLTVGDIRAKTRCRQGDIKPLTVLPPLPMPAHLSPATLPAHLASFNGLIYVDGSPQATEVARNLDIPTELAEVWSKALRQRKMTIRIGVDIDSLAAGLGRAEILGLYAPGEAIFIDADASSEQRPGASSPEDFRDVDGAYWNPVDTGRHELAHFDDDLRAEDYADSRSAADSLGNTAVSNTTLWADVIHALPDATVKAYASYHPAAQSGEAFGGVPGEIRADAWVGYQAALAVGATGAERFEIIGEKLAYGSLAEDEELSAGATIDAFFEASKKCGPIGSLEYRRDDEKRPAWVYEVGGGAVG